MIKGMEVLDSKNTTYETYSGVNVNVRLEVQ